VVAALHHPSSPDMNLSVEVHVVWNVERDMAVSKPAGLVLIDSK